MNLLDSAGMAGQDTCILGLVQGESYRGDGSAVLRILGDSLAAGSSSPRAIPGVLQKSDFTSVVLIVDAEKTVAALVPGLSSQSDTGSVEGTFRRVVS